MPEEPRSQEALKPGHAKPHTRVRYTESVPVEELNGVVMIAKAKSFTFVLDQIKSACDEVTKLVDNAPVVRDTDIWTCFVPAIKNKPDACSRYKSSREPRELVESILANVASVEEGSPYQTMATRLSEIVKDESSPFFEAVASEMVISKYFNDDSISTFLSLLHQDFGNASAYLFKEFEDSLENLLLRVALLSNRQLPGMTDARLDSIVVLLLASLYGPRDYRPELYMRVTSKDEATQPVRAGAEDFAEPEDRGVEQSPYLTRVTFSHNPPDEHDWIICQSSKDSADDQSGRFITYPLEGKTEALIARGFDRFDDDKSVLHIPVDCELASRNGHLRISFNDGNWILEDLHSTNGTLVVRRSGDRFCLYNDAEVPDSSIALQNGDVICIAPKWDTMHADPSCPAFVFHTATIDWI